MYTNIDSVIDRLRKDNLLFCGRKLVMKNALVKRNERVINVMKEIIDKYIRGDRVVCWTRGIDVLRRSDQIALMKIFADINHFNYKDYREQLQCIVWCKTVHFYNSWEE